jgi:NADPH:quinone reductase-like Zn-dependent oxidoreductase
MKAVMFEEHGTVDVLQYREDLPVPDIGPNEALIRIKAAAMNHNDLWVRRGVPGMTFILPHVSGTDAAGVVEAVGSEVEHIGVGDEVMVNGAFSCGHCHECVRGEPMSCPKFRIWGFQTGPNDGSEAEFGRVPARNLVPKPRHLSWEGAASLSSVLVTVWRMLVVRAGMKPGDLVLVWGATGGLGVMAVQLCKAFGSRSIAIAGSDEKCQLARELGADFVLNRTSQRLVREVMKVTERRGVDIVLEHTGASTWETSTYCLKVGGTIVTCGATTGFKAPLDIRFLWNKQQNYLGSHFGTTAELIDALKFVESDQIKPVVQEVLPLKDIARGHELLESGDVMGKIVVVPE